MTLAPIQIHQPLPQNGRPTNPTIYFDLFKDQTYWKSYMWSLCPAFGRAPKSIICIVGTFLTDGQGGELRNIYLRRWATKTQHGSFKCQYIGPQQKIGKNVWELHQQISSFFDQSQLLKEPIKRKKPSQVYIVILYWQVFSNSPAYHLFPNKTSQILRKD